jgi:hypothetical protein
MAPSVDALPTAGGAFINVTGVNLGLTSTAIVVTYVGGSAGLPARNLSFPPLTSCIVAIPGSVPQPHATMRTSCHVRPCHPAHVFIGTAWFGATPFLLQLVCACMRGQQTVAIAPLPALPSSDARYYMVCPTPIGVGANYSVVITVDGGSSVPTTRLLSFAPPVIESLTGPGAVGAPAAGGAVVNLHGVRWLVYLPLWLLTDNRELQF